ncbi:Mth938-like domain-containing protein [Limnobacter humi]|uniref:Mth938-like domain-containing protein n=1 Tax=Limnobacter humi TaxID=1778671 RepID=A0ABT1WI22_9BURK|nr:Mth938-like domain-containing protein [Limnobacter humi]MCQ8897155.1 Mth938-like domain-containing protein [Limnobacter humi]
MKFQPEALGAALVVQAYDEQGVVISGVQYQHSVVFGVDRAPLAWPKPGAEPINLDDAQWLLSQCPASMEVLLLGTGPKQVFPPIEVRRHFLNKRCPVEFMDSQAAARTYNILVGEGRQVVAALLL